MSEKIEAIFKKLSKERPHELEKEYGPYYPWHNMGGNTKPFWKDESAHELLKYQLGHTNEAINGFLRHPELDKLGKYGEAASENPEDFHYREETLKRVPHLDKAFEKWGVTTDEPVIVYRGMSGLHLPENLEQLEGLIIKDPSYMSTSLKEHVAKNMTLQTDPNKPGKKIRRVIVHVKVPKGKKFIPMSGFAPNQGSHDREREMLFPRNSKIKITRSWKDEDGKPHIDAEMI